MQITITIDDGNTADVTVINNSEEQGPTVGEQIRERRKNLGLTQRTLAQLAGISHATLCTLERGERKAYASTLKLIENALTAAENKNKGETK